jgi:prepilin-type N-terminal cleavage/methylation domain-containing protein
MNNNKFINKKIKSNGFSLIELIIATTIMSIVSLSIVTLITNQNREVKALTEKLTITDLQTQLQRTLNNVNYCNCLLRGKNFNTTALNISPANQIVSLPSGFSATPPAPALCTQEPSDLIPPVGRSVLNTNITVASVGLNNLQLISSNNYSADLQVEFGGTIRTIQGLRSKIFFSVNTSLGTPVSRPFVGCDTSLSGASLKIQRGTVTVPGCGGNICCETVNFPPGFFGATPHITVTPYFQDYGRGNNVLTSGIWGQSSAGFTACFDHNLIRITNSFDFYWMAIEEI